MNDKLKELKEAIEKIPTYDCIDLTIDNDKLIVEYIIAVDTITFEITIKDDCYIVIEKFYSEITGMTIEGNSKFNTLKEVLDFISISYTRLDDLIDELELIQLYASEIVTFEIKDKDTYFLVIRSYYSEESGITHEDEQTFENVKEILAYID